MLGPYRIMNLDTRYHDATRFTLPMYFIIGLAQCVSMIPGVSRSGTTIVSAMREANAMLVSATAGLFGVNR